MSMYMNCWLNKLNIISGWEVFIPNRFIITKSHKKAVKTLLYSLDIKGVKC